MKLLKIILLFFLSLNSLYSSLIKIAIVTFFNISIFLLITLIFVSLVITPYFGSQFLTNKS